MMVTRSSVQHFHMDIATDPLREPFEEIVDQLALQIAHALDVQRQVDDRVRASAEIHRRHGQRFIHRHDEVAGAVDAAARAERLRHGLAQRNAEILNRVVLIDVQIACGANFEIERTVARHQLEHVIEKPDSGTDVVPPFALDAETHTNLRLARFSVDYGTPHKPSSTSTAASVCRTTPAVMRMQPAQPGSRERSRTRMPRSSNARTISAGSPARATLINTKLPALFQ